MYTIHYFRSVGTRSLQFLATANLLNIPKNWVSIIISVATGPAYRLPLHVFRNRNYSATIARVVFVRHSPAAKASDLEVKRTSSQTCFLVCIMFMNESYLDSLTSFRAGKNEIVLMLDLGEMIQMLRCFNSLWNEVLQMICPMGPPATIANSGKLSSSLDASAVRIETVQFRLERRGWHAGFRRDNE